MDDPHPMDNIGKALAAGMDKIRKALAAGAEVLLLHSEEAPPAIELCSSEPIRIPETVSCPVCGFVYIKPGDVVWVCCAHWEQEAPERCQYCGGAGSFFLHWLPPMVCPDCTVESDTETDEEPDGDEDG